MQIDGRATRIEGQHGSEQYRAGKCAPAAEHCRPDKIGAIGVADCDWREYFIVMTCLEDKGRELSHPKLQVFEIEVALAAAPEKARFAFFDYVATDR